MGPSVHSKNRDRPSDPALANIQHHDHFLIGFRLHKQRSMVAPHGSAGRTRPVYCCSRSPGCAC
eukprot:434569-Alexandrium_andersonii.AAC.1